MTAVTATDPNAGFHAQSGGRRRGLARVADLRIGVRLAALGAVLCAVLLGVGIYTISALGTVSGQAQSINTNGIVHPNNLHLARSSMLEARMDFVKVVVAADEHKDTAAAIATLQQADQSVDQPFNEYRSTLDPVSSTDASKRAAMTDAANNLAAWRNQKDIMLASVAKGNGAGAYAAMVAAAPYGAKVGADLDAAVASENAEAKGTAAHVQSISNSTRTMAIGLLVGGVVLAAALIVLTTLGITRPLRKAVTVLDAVGDGDFTGRIGVDSKDEIGQMSASVDRLADKLATALRSIDEEATSLAASSDQLSSVSALIASNAEETSAQSSTVSAAAEQMSASVEGVAAATEEMSASIAEIAKSAGDAAAVAAGAADEAARTNESVGQLARASVEIGEVAQLIASIADQTNLLALNATIESARAGDAGKSFGVVANEVKELAKQTADATAQITSRIDAIQGSASEVVAAIGRINAVIDKINESQNTIAAAVEEQTATANEIGRNVSEAANRTSEIARSMTDVASATNQTAEGTTQSQVAADQLARVAGELQQLVGQFRY